MIKARQKDTPPQTPRLSTGTIMPGLSQLAELFRRRRTLLLCLGLLLFFPFLFVFFTVDIRFETIEQRRISTPEGGVTTLQGVQVIFNTNDGTSLLIEAKEVLRHADTPFLFQMNGITARLERGNSIKTLTAPRGKLDIESSILHLEDDVILNDSNGSVSRAEKVAYAFLSQELTIDNIKEARYPHISLTGDQIIINARNKAISSTGKTQLVIENKVNESR